MTESKNEAMREYERMLASKHESVRDQIASQSEYERMVAASQARENAELERSAQPQPREASPVPVGHLDSINEPGSHAPPLLEEGSGGDGGTASETAPVITALEPDSCLITDDDFTLKVSGTGFTDASVIHFAGHDEPTTLEEDGSLSTGVKPSLWQTEAVVQCSVRNGGAESNIVDFTFNAPATRQQKD